MTTLSLESLPARAGDLANNKVIWIDMQATTADEEERIFGQFLPIHLLTREDISRRTGCRKRGAPAQGEEFDETSS